jgi:heterotetrameric sarcosine oxidase gamma subunit
VLNLIAKSPASSLVPLTIGTVELTEAFPDAITFLSAFSGKTDSLSDVLKSSHGMALPGPNRATGRDGARAIWFGSDVALIGPKPNEELASHCAMVDQSDAWCVLRMSGQDIEAVMARLCPVDMRINHFKRGHVVRSQMVHMNVVYHRVSDQVVDIYGFRSMASTMVHEIKTAMESVAA